MHLKETPLRFLGPTLSVVTIVTNGSLEMNLSLLLLLPIFLQQIKKIIKSSALAKTLWPQHPETSLDNMFAQAADLA